MASGIFFSINRSIIILLLVYSSIDFIQDNFLNKLEAKNIDINRQNAEYRTIALQQVRLDNKGLIIKKRDISSSTDEQLKSPPPTSLMIGNQSNGETEIVTTTGDGQENTSSIDEDINHQVSTAASDSVAKEAVNTTIDQQLVDDNQQEEASNQDAKVVEITASPVQQQEPANIQNIETNESDSTSTSSETRKQEQENQKQTDTNSDQNSSIVESSAKPANVDQSSLSVEQQQLETTGSSEQQQQSLSPSSNESNEPSQSNESNLPQESQPKSSDAETGESQAQLDSDQQQQTNFLSGPITTTNETKQEENRVPQPVDVLTPPITQVPESPVIIVDKIPSQPAKQPDTIVPTQLELQHSNEPNLEQKQVDEQQQQQTNTSSANTSHTSKQIIANELIMTNAIQPITNGLVSNATIDNNNNTNQQSVHQHELPTKIINDYESFSYDLDNSTCQAHLLSKGLPESILKMTIERILSMLVSTKCNDKLDLKLKSLLNKQIKGQVLEVSSMPIYVEQLISNVNTIVKCNDDFVTKKEAKEENSNSSSKINFSLTFDQDLDDQKLRSRWRRYPQLQLDDIPLSTKFNIISSSNNQQQQQLLSSHGQHTSMMSFAPKSSKCQKFKIDSGDFYLELLSFKTSLNFQVELKQYNESGFAASDKHGGKLRIKQFKVNELYLDHSLSLNNINNSFSNSKKRSNDNNKQEQPTVVPLPTVQVLHDHNNHHRRNNWLLNVYGIWLKHEYKKQLNSLLLSRNFLEQLNSCLVEY